MKIIRICLFFMLVQLSAAQEEVSYDKSIVVYDTYDDFENENGTYVGRVESYSWTDLFGSNKLYYVDNNQEEKKLNINKYWGFSIGEYMFRNKKGNPRIPLAIVKHQEVVIYMDGYLFISMIIKNSASGSSSRTKKSVFYSNELDSDIYEISKILKKEKNNPALANFRACIKKGTKRYGYQAKLNGYTKCIKGL